MRTFYIFKINKNYYNLTKNIPYNLYLALLNIKMGTKDNIDLLYNEYFTYIDTINKNEISKHLFNKLKNNEGYRVYENIHQYSNYYSDEESKLSIYNSFMILKSNKNNSSFIKELLNIPYLFIIDFESEDYFFLNRIKPLNAC